jgi:hypothetical protein
MDYSVRSDASRRRKHAAFVNSPNLPRPSPKHFGYVANREDVAKSHVWPFR